MRPIGDGAVIPAPRKQPTSQKVVRRPHSPSAGGTIPGIDVSKVRGKPARSTPSRTAPKPKPSATVVAAAIAKGNRILAFDEARAQSFARAAKAKPKTGNAKAPAAAKPKAKSSGTKTHTHAPVSKGHTGSGSHSAGTGSTSPATNTKAVGSGGGVDWLRLIELGALAAGVILLLIYVRRSKRRR